MYQQKPKYKMIAVHESEVYPDLLMVAHHLEEKQNKKLSFSDVIKYLLQGEKKWRK